MLNNNSLELLPQHMQSNNNNKKYEETLYVVPEIFLVERDRHTFVLKNSFLYVPNSSWRYLYCSIILDFTFHGSFKAVFLVSLSGPCVGFRTYMERAWGLSNWFSVKSWLRFISRFGSVGPNHLCGPIHLNGLYCIFFLLDEKKKRTWTVLSDIYFILFHYFLKERYELRWPKIIFLGRTAF